MLVRPKIIADLFTNLAAGWFGLILVVRPESVSSLITSLFGGILSLLITEYIYRIYDFS